MRLGLEASSGRVPFRFLLESRYPLAQPVPGMPPLRVARPGQRGHVALSLAELPRFLNDLRQG